jgi:nitroimidazol reductase NimA-like FMN-containing flavoprotein (pyridoxamine 5'-phosphate oxidase superfamily)
MQANILLNDTKIEQFLNKSKIPIRLSLKSTSGWPTILSLWYIYNEGSIWCATKENALVIKYLKVNPRCAFEIAGDSPPYRGIRGQGKATLIKEKGIEVLKLLLNRYLGGIDSPLAKNLLDKAENEIAIKILPINIFKWDYTKRMKNSLK